MSTALSKETLSQAALLPVLRALRSRCTLRTL
jgi:hypothetical protein